MRSGQTKSQTVLYKSEKGKISTKKYVPKCLINYRKCFSLYDLKRLLITGITEKIISRIITKNTSTDPLN